jgi:hypothetical protein
MIGALLVAVSAGLMLAGLALSMAVSLGLVPPSVTVETHGGLQRSAVAPKLRLLILRRVRASSSVVMRTYLVPREGGGHPTGGRMAPVMRGWALSLGDVAAGTYRRVAAASGRRHRPSEPGTAAELRAELARLLAEPQTPAAAKGAVRRTAGLAPALVLRPAIAAGKTRRRRPRLGPSATAWVSAACVVGTVTTGGLVHRLVAGAAPPPTAHPSAVRPVSPAPSGGHSTTGVAQLQGGMSVEPPGMRWESPVGTMSLSPLVTFTVENTGHVPVSVGSVATTDPAFRITADTCSRTHLAPTELCHVTVQFQTSTPEHHAGVLVVPDDTGAPPQRQPLTGGAR